MTDSSPQFTPHPRFAPPDKLSVSLVAPAEQQAKREWAGVGAEVLGMMTQDRPGRIKVVGAAGTGVSSLVIDSVLARMSSGVSPSRILVLAAAKESGAHLRRELSAALPSLRYASDSPLVRSIHSFAFAIVRLAAQRELGAAAEADGRAPRLITGAEQDLVVRELLALEAELGGTSWPESVREGITLVGFARQLRDFLLRAQERGIGAHTLQELGRQYNRPMWESAGRFLVEYYNVTQLSGAQLYNASELVTAALAILHNDPDLLAEQSARIDTIVVDDMQHLDPKSAELVELFAAHASCALIAGNPAHTVFHFRGASPKSLLDFPADHEFTLDERLRPTPSVDVLCCDSTATEMTTIADTLRRKNLLESVDWRDMAVIVRSSGAIATVRRALLSAGVPVTIQPTDVVLSQQRLVANVLLACRGINEELAAAELEELILGPVGGADSVTLRRLMRGLRQLELRTGGTRRAIEVFRELVTTPEEPVEEQLTHLTSRERDILHRIRTVLQAGVNAHGRGESVEMILWEVWDATGLSERLMNAALRGGAIGSSADLDLDAMMTLFDAAGDFVERRPTASIDRFVQYIEEQELPSGARDRRGEARNAVSVLTAHASVGMQWRVVAVAGVQEGAWPSLGETGTLFGQEELVDLVDNNIDPNTIIARTAERVADEHRLFHIAVSRATDEVCVSAVLDAQSDEVDEPSRFLTELAQSHDIRIRIVGQEEPSDESHFAESALGYAPELCDYPRLLSQPSIVAELRRVVCNPQASPPAVQVAAAQLARLARADIFGAHPDQWWGLRGPSTDQQVLDITSGATVSPSRIESGLTCPLRAALGNLGEEDDTPIHLIKGNLVHAAAEAYVAGVPRDQVTQLVREAYSSVLNSPRWRTQYDLKEWDAIIDCTLNYVETHDLVGAEIPILVDVATMPDGTPIRIAGRMDRLELNADGDYLIVDLKTSKHMPAQKSMSDHQQLAAYQLALSQGTLIDARVVTRTDDEPALPLGGGVLIFPANRTAKGAAGKRDQAPKDAAQLAEFAAMLPQLVADLTGPQLEARINDNCDHCQLKKMCPAHNEGQALTHV